MPRSRLLFSFTVKSPVLASVTAASPICSPVRRDVLSTSGVLRRICSTCSQHPIRLGQRAARGHDVVEHEAAFVHLRQQVGAKLLVAEPGADDQQHAEQRRASDGSRQRPVEHALDASAIRGPARAPAPRARLASSRRTITQQGPGSEPASRSAPAAATSAAPPSW